jgi:protein TonB
MLLLGSGAEAQEGYRVVVNAANPVSALSKSQMSKLFLDKATWDDGVVVSPVDQLPESTVRSAFSKEVLGAPVSSAIERMRLMRKVSGADMPPAVASDREVLAYVRLKPGAIGYVSLAADVTGVKVVATGGKAETTTAAGVAPVEVGGTVAVPQRLSHVQPVYPEMAKQGRVQGTVSLSVVISSAGAVERAKVVRSIPALDEAAISAVRQWKYSPTVVNGVAVPVTMVVHVNFAL